MLHEYCYVVALLLNHITLFTRLGWLPGVSVRTCFTCSLSRLWDFFLVLLLRFLLLLLNASESFVSIFHLHGWVCHSFLLLIVASIVVVCVCVCAPVKARTECEIDEINKGNTKHIQNTTYSASIYWRSFVRSHFILSCLSRAYSLFHYSRISDNTLVHTFLLYFMKLL